MGMSVTFHVYDVDKLKYILDNKVTLKEDQMMPSEFLDKVMDKIGVVHYGTFIIQSCDYWNEYDPYVSLQRAMEAYYQIGDLYDSFHEAQIGWHYEGHDECEIYDLIGLKEYPMHPDEEEEDELE